jgi:predicted nucleotidyltransferase
MSNRPYVSIKENNILEELMEALNRSLPGFQLYEGLAGIMLDGGMSRGYADHLSEIDVVIFLHEANYENYQKQLTPTGLGITVMDGYLYDVKLLNYENELNRTYDSVGLWDLSYAKILYDPAGELKTLFDLKLATPVELSQAEGLMFEAWWNYRLAGDIWLQRKDAIQGHYILNHAIKPLISALFIANQEYIPHDKWLIHMSKTLHWLPEHYEAQLLNVLSAGAMDTESLLHRQTAINTLWNEIDERLRDATDCPKSINFMHRGTYNRLKDIYEKKTYIINEWLEKFSLEDLNYEPLRSVLALCDNEISFDSVRAEKLSEKEIYSWFYQVVKAVLAEQE